MSERVYAAIDLKSFYASVECAERGLNPLNTNLVVADESRTEKTICLAVSPSLKSWGISGRARLFEVVERVKQVNAERKNKAPRHTLTGSSCFHDELTANPDLSLDYIIAPPRMALYMEYSTMIYQIYLRYIAPQDIHVYSVDEVFLDLTGYLKTYGMTARQLTMKLIHDVLAQTGITATAGIGDNLYLCKIAMDIVAKHIPADADGVRIAELNEMSYREQLWSHKPLTSFWRIGHGIAAKLEANGMYTMGDVARVSMVNEDLLYKLFGVNAELIIDHAWGWQPCTIKDIKSYVPEDNSISHGQVLSCAYNAQNGRMILREMAQQLVLDLVDKGLITDQLVLTIGYDGESLLDSTVSRSYRGAVELDRYGRKVPKSAHGSINAGAYTSSGKLLVQKAVQLYDKLMDPQLLVRRMSLVANHVIPQHEAVTHKPQVQQLDIFTDWHAEQEEREAMEQERKRQKQLQLAEITMRKKFGKNILFRAADLQEGATTLERNRQIGGHKA